MLPTQFQNDWVAFRDRCDQIGYRANIHAFDEHGFTIYKIYINGKPSKFASVSFEKLIEMANEWLTKEIDELDAALLPHQEGGIGKSVPEEPEFR